MTSSSPRSLSDWLNYIEALHPSEIEMGLERIKKVYRKLPQFPENLAVVTVAGTNGKGSTVASIEALAKSKGLSVGSYTSPHILTYNERVQINQVPVSDDTLVNAFHLVESARGDVQLTYFEFGTLAAFVILAASEIDIAVLEIGLGGRLDAVNIVDPDVAVVTTVDMDHEGWLGTTREAIATEKAGIVRKGATFICGDENPPQALLDAANIAQRSLMRGTQFDLLAMPGDRWQIRWQSKGNDRLMVLPDGLPVLPQNLLNGVQAFSELGYELTDA
ncbi:MAG: bifunctional folylpolyglutamate synthase/dihydrofolate synthase, partial [Gammaproteobacteria bacterium]